MPVRQGGRRARNRTQGNKVRPHLRAARQPARPVQTGGATPRLHSTTSAEVFAPFQHNGVEILYLLDGVMETATAPALQNGTGHTFQFEGKSRRPHQSGQTTHPFPLNHDLHRGPRRAASHLVGHSGLPSKVTAVAGVQQYLVSSSGQVSSPAAARHRWGLDRGGPVDVIDLGFAVVMLPEVTQAPPSPTCCRRRFTRSSWRPCQRTRTWPRRDRRGARRSSPPRLHDPGRRRRAGPDPRGPRPGHDQPLLPPPVSERRLRPRWRADGLVVRGTPPEARPAAARVARRRPRRSPCACSPTGWRRSRMPIPSRLSVQRPWPPPRTSTHPCAYGPVTTDRTSATRHSGSAPHTGSSPDEHRTADEELGEDLVGSVPGDLDLLVRHARQGRRVKQNHHVRNSPGTRDLLCL